MNIKARRNRRAARRLISVLHDGADHPKSAEEMEVEGWLWSVAGEPLTASLLKNLACLARVEAGLR